MLVYVSSPLSIQDEDRSSDGTLLEEYQALLTHIFFPTTLVLVVL